MKTKGGRLVPMKQRMNKFQLQKRSDKMVARRTIAEQLSRQQSLFMAGIAKVLDSYLNRGFWGRLKFVFAGR